MKKRILPYFALWAVCQMNCFADVPEVLIPTNQALYVVIADIGSEREGQMRQYVPDTKISKLVLQKNKYGEVEKGSLHDVQVFDVLRTDFVLMSHGQTNLAIGARHRDGYSIHMLRTDAPTSVRAYKPKMFSAINFLSIAGTSYLANYTFTSSQKGQLKLIDLASLAEKDSKLEDWQYVQDAEILSVNEKLSFRRKGLESVPFPYVPPKAYIQNLNRLALVCNSLTHVVLSEMPSTENGKATRIEILKKSTGKWLEYSVKGNRTRVKVVGQFVVCRIGWSFPEETSFGPVFTGEWLLIDWERGTKQTFLLGQESDILFANDSFAVVFTGGSLQYVPITDRILSERDRSVLCTDQLMRSVKVVFLGPAVSGESGSSDANNTNPVSQKIKQQ